LNLISQRLDTIYQIKPKRATVRFLHLFTPFYTTKHSQELQSAPSILHRQSQRRPSQARTATSPFPSRAGGIRHTTSFLHLPSSPPAAGAAPRPARQWSRDIWVFRLPALMDLYIHPLYVLVSKILSSILNSSTHIYPLNHHLSTLSTVGPTCHFI
jgi:hypothetical protein